MQLRLEFSLLATIRDGRFVQLVLDRTLPDAKLRTDSFVLERSIRVLIFVYRTFSCTAGDDSCTNEEESQHKFTSTVLTVPSMHHTLKINMKLTKKARWCTMAVQRCTRRVKARSHGPCKVD